MIDLERDIDQMLPSARQLAVATCTGLARIDRPGLTCTDPDTGETTTESTLVYMGRCRIASWKSFGALEHEQPLAEGTPTIQRHQIILPSIDPTGATLTLADGYSPEEGDIATVLEMRRQPELVGRRYRIDQPHIKTDQTSLRLGCSEVV